MSIHDNKEVTMAAVFDNGMSVKFKGPLIKVAIEASRAEELNTGSRVSVANFRKIWHDRAVSAKTPPSSLYLGHWFIR